jgi:uncharacterized protein (DUF1810 family)
MRALVSTYRCAATRRAIYTTAVPTLERFKDAQEQSYGGFAAALAELESGRKRGHWIWYIFPQLAGLGSSNAAVVYAIADVDEAIEYLRDRVLRERLIAVTSAVATHLQSGARLSDIMGAEIDALKLVSSLTLFEAVATRLSDQSQSAEDRAPAGQSATDQRASNQRAANQTAADRADYQRLAGLARDVLAAADAQGYPRCRFTLDQLKTSRGNA